MVRALKYREVTRVLRLLGWEPVSIRGSHEKWKFPDDRGVNLTRRTELSKGIARDVINELGDQTPKEWK